MPINPETGRWTGKFDISDLTEDEEPKHTRTDLADYVKMLEVSYKNGDVRPVTHNNGTTSNLRLGKAYGIDVDKGAHTIAISRFRGAAAEMGIGVKLEVVDPHPLGTPGKVRLRFQAREKRQNPNGPVTTRKMPAKQQAAAKKAATTKAAANKTAAVRRTR